MSSYKKILIGLICVALLTMAVVVGCSDDDDKVVNPPAPTQYSLTINISPDSTGTVTVDPQKTTWLATDTTTLTAVADSFYAFDHWMYFDTVVTGNPVELTFEDDRNEVITAVFVDDSLSRLITLEGIVFRNGIDLAYPVLVLMNETLDTVLLAWSLPGGSDTAAFTVQFPIEDAAGSHIHAVDNLNNDSLVFEDNEPWQCYDSDDVDSDCDFITYTMGQEITGLELQLFISAAPMDPTPLPFKPIRLDR